MKESPTISRKRGSILSLLFILPLVGCDTFLPGAPEDQEVLEGPIETLTSEQLRLHLVGDAEFGAIFTPESGLGPIFNATSCAQCHVGDGKGHPLFNLTRFGRMTADGFDPMVEFGGPQLQDRAIPGHPPETMPPGVTGFAAFTAPAITGLGYLEAVDDTTLLNLEDPDDLNGDGISGRVQLHTANDLLDKVTAKEAAFHRGPRTRGLLWDGQYIGRFGKKALTVNLLQQTAGAYVNDMGVTTDVFPQDPLNVQVGNFTSDGVPDPEVASSVLDAVVFYVKTLRIPPRRDEGAPDVEAGEGLFSQVGCASCHLPTLRTGRSEIAALDRVEFHPFTDLLLHDMGPGLDDGYTEGRATTAEWRTPPLWGIGLVETTQGGQAFFLHDGRAQSLEDAIALHGGEGSASRSAFQALSPDQRRQLLTYLRSL